MKSEVCYMEGNGSGREAAMKEVEKVAEYCGLNRKNTLRLSLLAEELFAMVREIAGNYKAAFWVEEEAGKFRICLTANTKMNANAKEKLVAASTSGENEEHRGIMGKIRGIFEACVDGYREGEDFRNENGIFSVYDGAGIGNFSGGDAYTVWSLVNYREKIKEDTEKYAESWDELEKSIIANLADEVTVGIKDKQAKVVIIKQF